MTKRTIANTPLPGGGRLADTIILRSRILYIGDDDALFQWAGSRWRRLIPQEIPKRPTKPRQRRAYAGHPALAGKLRSIPRA